MQDSFGGDAKTLMVVSASPSSENTVELVHTLQFATRVKRVYICNQVKKTETLKVPR